VCASCKRLQIMRDERRILLNATVLSVFEGLGQLANLILVVRFARVYGAGTMGYYSVGMSAGAVAAIFVSLGIPGLLIRDISRDPSCASDRLGVLLPVQLVLAPLAWAIACAASIALIGNSTAIGVVMATCGYQVLLPLTTLMLVPLQATEQMLVSAGCNLLHRVLILLLGLTAIRLGGSAEIVALTFVVGVLGLIALSWRQVSRRFGAPAWRFRPAEALKLYRLAAPFFGLSALSVLYARGATLMLSALTTAQAVGLYAIADRLMVALGLGSTMFNAAAYPALARVAHSSAADARALLARCLRLLLVMAIPFAALAAIFASDIVRLFFGTSYLGAVRALEVLAWTLPIRGAQALLGSQLAAMSQQAALARTRLVGLVTFLALCPALVVSVGYVGAAWAVLSCDALQLALYWRLLTKGRMAPALTIAYLAPAAAAAASAAISALLADMGLAARLTGAIVAMVAGMWAFGAIKLHDLRFLQTLIVGKEPTKTA
jgi:O-antigen/teichoic acid export membrane protein